MSSLLPGNSRPAEHALAETIARLSDIPVPIRSVWNADTLRGDLLPWLAWAFSLDEWDINWTEAQKRGAIKASLQVHKHKGTIGAMRAALAGLGLGLEVVEWYQKEPAGDPYTFGLKMTVDQEPLGGEAEYNRILSVALSAKNVRSQLDSVEVIGLANGTIYYGGVLCLGDTVNIDAEP